jgi:hypothetical protein
LPGEFGVWVFKGLRNEDILASLVRSVVDGLFP